DQDPDKEPFNLLFEEDFSPRPACPFKDIRYEQYVRDMWVLAKYVRESAFMHLANPYGSIPSSEFCRLGYKEMVPAFMRSEERFGPVMDTLDRWSVLPRFLRDIPLDDDRSLINVYESNIGTQRSATGNSILDMLHVALKHGELHWQSSDPREPAVFWDSVAGTPHRAARDVSPKPGNDSAAAVSMKSKTTEPDPPPKKPKSRVEFGLAAHGEIRERDLERVQLQMEKHLGRYLTVMIVPVAGAAFIRRYVPIVRLLARQAQDEAIFGKRLTGMPLSPVSFFTLGWSKLQTQEASAQSMTIRYVPCTTDDVRMRERFVELPAFWRLHSYVGKQMNGSLSDSVRREWDARFKTFEKACGSIVAYCTYLERV
ncbi:hypothetical protein EBZ37_14545, partial [bacterium]|nr:hypothetical protein [bacterium]